MGIFIFLAYLSSVALSGKNVCEAINWSAPYLSAWIFWTTILCSMIFLIAAAVNFAKNKPERAGHQTAELITCVMGGYLYIQAANILVKITESKPTSFVDYPRDLVIIMFACYIIGLLCRQSFYIYNGGKFKEN